MSYISDPKFYIKLLTRILGKLCEFQMLPLLPLPEIAALYLALEVWARSPPTTELLSGRQHKLRK